MLHVHRDGLVGQAGGVGGLPVVLQARRHQRVEGAVQRGVRHLADHLGDRRGDVPEALDQPLPLARRSPVQHDTSATNGSPDPVLRHERQRWRDLEGREAAVLARRGPDEVVEVLQDGGAVGQLEEHRAAVDGASTGCSR